MPDHALSLAPKTHVVACACGETWRGQGALRSAEAHIRFETGASRAFRRARRLKSLRFGLTTAQAAERWRISHRAAYHYLRGLKRVGKVAERIERGFPSHAYWTIA